MGRSRIQLYELELQRDARQQQVLEAASGPLREKLEWIQDWFDRDWQYALVSRYELAVQVREVHDDVVEGNGRRYGANAVEALKAYFAWDAGTIYQMLKLADAFTAEEIEAIATKRLPSGRPVSFSHLVELADVDDPKQRQQLLDRTVREDWTSKRLGKAVQQLEAPAPKTDRARRGRPLAVPRDFDSALAQQHDFIADFMARDRDVWGDPSHSLAGKSSVFDPADFTRERADRLKGHAERMRALARRAQWHADQAARLHGLFNQVIAEREARTHRTALPAALDGAG